VNVIIFGASGMVGQGVLRECLLAPSVERVLVVGRAPLGARHDKVRDIVHTDFADFSGIEGELSGYDACFYCLGVSSAGMSEPAYTRVTFDFTLAAAKTLAKQNPAMTFVYVSGAGTDSSEAGRSMWARVKGKTENALLRLPFRRAFMFRPAFIQPMHGIVSKTRLYRVAYVAVGPLYPLLKALAPGVVSTTENVGKAMLQAVLSAAPSGVVENREINALAQEF